jgi:hypothetical protein
MGRPSTSIVRAIRKASTLLSVAVHVAQRAVVLVTPTFGSIREGPDMEERRLLTTLTGELFQPARLYYQTFDLRKIEASLSRLRCVEVDPCNGRFVWLYRDESGNLRFVNPYSSIPPERRPIVLGSIYFRQQGEILLDVRSFDRATKAVVFFDKYIERSTARVTHAAVINRLFDRPGESAEAMTLLDSQPVDRNPSELVELTKEWAKGKSAEERLRAAMPFLEQLGRQHFPEFERFPVNFYEEGIASLERLLKIRQAVALEHWKGNKDFTVADLMSRIL